MLSMGALTRSLQVVRRDGCESEKSLTPPRKGQHESQKAKQKPVTAMVTGFSLAQWEGFKWRRAVPKNITL